MRDQDRSTREPAAPIEPAQYEPSRMDEKDGPESRGRRKFLKTAALTDGGEPAGVGDAALLYPVWLVLWRLRSRRPLGGMCSRG